MTAFRSLIVAGILAVACAIPSVASAAPGYTTGSVNLRDGPGTKYRKITVVPAGARIEVYRCTSWCRINYRGYRGWVYAKYVAIGGIYRRPAPIFRPPPPLSGFIVRPWWDDRYGAWYDGRRWYYDGRWYRRPSFSFELHIGR